MGVGAAPKIGQSLLKKGLGDKTPVTIAADVTKRDQRVLTTTIADLAHDISCNGIVGNALFIIRIPRIERSRLTANTRVSVTPRGMLQY